MENKSYQCGICLGEFHKGPSGRSIQERVANLAIDSIHKIDQSIQEIKYLKKASEEDLDDSMRKIDLLTEEKFNRSEKKEGHNCALIETDCGHVYHEQCLRTWMEKKSNCPMCRHDLPKDLYFKGFSELLPYRKGYFNSKAMCEKSFGHFVEFIGSNHKLFQNSALLDLYIPGDHPQRKMLKACLKNEKSNIEQAAHELLTSYLKEKIQDPEQKEIKAPNSPLNEPTLEEKINKLPLEDKQFIYRIYNLMAEAAAFTGKFKNLETMIDQNIVLQTAAGPLLQICLGHALTNEKNDLVEKILKESKHLRKTDILEIFFNFLANDKFDAALKLCKEAKITPQELKEINTQLLNNGKSKAALFLIQNFKELNLKNPEMKAHNNLMLEALLENKQLAKEGLDFMLNAGACLDESVLKKAFLKLILFGEIESTEKIKSKVNPKAYEFKELLTQLALEVCGPNTLKIYDYIFSHYEPHRSDWEIALKSVVHGNSDIFWLLHTKLDIKDMGQSELQTAMKEAIEKKEEKAIVFLTKNCKFENKIFLAEMMKEAAIHNMEMAALEIKELIDEQEKNDRITSEIDQTFTVAVQNNYRILIKSLLKTDRKLLDSKIAHAILESKKAGREDLCQLLIEEACSKNLKKLLRSRALREFEDHTDKDLSLRKKAEATKSNIKKQKSTLARLFT